MYVSNALALLILSVLILVIQARWDEADETFRIEFQEDSYLRFHKHSDTPKEKASNKNLDAKEARKKLALKRGRKLEEILSKLLVRDSGKVTNCGKPGTKLDVTWSPKVVNADGKVEVNVDAVAPVDFNTAQGVVNVYLEGGKDPIISTPETLTCQQAKKYVPSLNCPIKKGTPFKMKRLFDLSPYHDNIPEGNFTIVGNATNENNEQIFCMKATVHILSPDTD